MYIRKAIGKEVRDDALVWLISICGVLPNDTELSRRAIPLSTCLSSGEGNIEERLEYRDFNSTQNTDQRLEQGPTSAFLPEENGGKCVYAMMVT
jgi:hypothetical protein